MKLINFLKQNNTDSNLSEIVMSFEKSSQEILRALIEEEKELSWTTNVQWEDQMSLDLICDEIMTRHVSNCKWVNSIVSEEQDKIVSISDKWDYTVAFDPIDWSSLLDTNLSVWSIFAIFEWDTVIGQKIKDIKCAGCIIYWPRISMLISFWDSTHEFTIKDWWFVLTKANIKISKDTKLFSPWNLRACRENPKYKAVFDKWLEQAKTLRYSGWMVPDVNAIFMKWQGIFSYPWYSKYPNWKLRLVYEVWPFSFMANACWWLALTESWQNIMDLKIHDIHERSTIFIWSENEVRNVVDMLN